MTNNKFSTSEIKQILVRFIKPDVLKGNLVKERILFYKIFNKFPNINFWKVYSLEFQLNSFAWFLSEDGNERLTNDISIFTLDLGSQEKYTLEKEKIGEDIKVIKKPKTVAELLKKK